MNKDFLYFIDSEDKTLMSSMFVYSAKELSEEVTVCDKCMRACCWQGEFMCDESQMAGTVDMPRSCLIMSQNGESESYMTNGDSTKYSNTKFEELKKYDKKNTKKKS